MPEPLYIHMPEAAAKKKGRLLLRLMPLWVLAALAGAGWLWFESGRIPSSWAMVDGMVYAVSAEFPARVEAVHVREGDHVKRGQVLARLDARNYSQRYGEAVRETSGLRSLIGPPSIEETAARLKSAQESELDMTRRLALARQAEDMKQKQRQERIAEHVRLQLALRTLDSQGGEASVGKGRYAAARQAEANARAAKEQVEVEFEQASLARAAMDQELNRVREEMLRYKQMVSRERYAQPQYVKQARAAAATRQQAPDGNLYAPQDGRILRGLAAPGQTVRGGDPVVLLLPEGPEAQNAYWLLAYFPLETKSSIKPGQKCSITLKQSGTKFEGSVYDLLEPQPLPSTASSSSVGDSKDAGAPTVYLPVRISLKNMEAQPLMPGDEAICTVVTRTLWNY